MDIQHFTTHMTHVKADAQRVPLRALGNLGSIAADTDIIAPEWLAMPATLILRANGALILSFGQSHDLPMAQMENIERHGDYLSFRVPDGDIDSLHGMTLTIPAAPYDALVALAILRAMCATIWR